MFRTEVEGCFGGGGGCWFVGVGGGGLGGGGVGGGVWGVVFVNTEGPDIPPGPRLKMRGRTYRDFLGRRAVSGSGLFLTCICSNKGKIVKGTEQSCSHLF